VLKSRGLASKEADWLPDPDTIRSRALTFKLSNSFGSEAVYPGQIALLSDSLLWDISTLCAAFLRLSFAPNVVFIIIRLIPKPASVSILAQA
jgi:hypothetical protein